MASIPIDTNPPRGLDDPSVRSSQPTLAELKRALIIVISLFFMWGFITCLNDILIPKLKAEFSLNYLQASLIQFTFFGAYFLVSLPCGLIISRLGYQRGMVIGLATAALGTLLFCPAASAHSFSLFLTALFVLASGITLLQVGANPYVAHLGAPESAAARLNLAQAFNSLGTTVAPIFGGWLILANIPPGALVATTEASAVQMPYLALTLALGVLALLIGVVKLPRLQNVTDSGNHHGSLAQVWQHWHLRFAVVGIFLYVGAEVSIGSYLVNFMNDPEIAGFTPSVAATYLSYYWGGAMAGRFLGSTVFRGVAPNLLLAVNAAAATSLCFVGLFVSGHLALWAVLSIGLFNSIMFPNIFTLGIDRLGHLTGRGSSLLVMSIVGGAVVPVIMGRMADQFGVHHSLFVPGLCYLYVIFFGLYGFRAGLK